MTDNSFDGKCVLVTGGGSGIGQSACVELASRGANVVVCDISEAGIAETVEMLSGTNGSALAISMDVSDEEQVENAVTRALEEFGRLDCAVNNAAIIKAVPFLDITLENWHEMIEINLTSVFLCMRAEIRQMMAQGGGSIVNVSSGAAFVPTKGLSHYTASKSGVLGLTKSGAIEFARDNIRINSVVPGSTDTPMLRQALAANPAGVEEISKRWVMGRQGRPEEVAAAAVWLCSDAASFVNGSSIVVDGGLILR